MAGAVGADDVSLSVAAVLGAHAQSYQSLTAQIAEFHQEFVQTSVRVRTACANAENANAAAVANLWQTVQRDLLNAAPGGVGGNAQLIGNEGHGGNGFKEPDATGGSGGVLPGVNGANRQQGP